MFLRLHGMLILSTGSRDRTILHRDVRSPQQCLTKHVGHKQEVCSLRWNSDTNQLASGGNDNKIFIWDGLGDRWLHRWGEQEGGHKAAVKAYRMVSHINVACSLVEVVRRIAA